MKKQHEETVKATRGEETREFSKTQWEIMGSNPELNGGWKVAEPEESKTKSK